MTLATPTIERRSLPRPGTPRSLSLGRVAPGRHAVFATLPWPMLVCSELGVVVDSNSAAVDEFGDTSGRTLGALLEDGLGIDGLIGTVLATGVAAETTVVTLAGWSGHLYLHVIEAGRWVGATIRPATDESRREKALRAQESRFSALCAHAPAGILCAASGMRVDYVNERCAEAFGVDAEELWGFGWLSGLADETQTELAVQAVEDAVDGRTVGPLAFDIRRPDGSLRQLDARFAPNDGGFVATFEDVTEARGLADRLERQARHDELTGLGNRRVMVESINAVVGEIRSGALASASLIFIDLDNFKYVNDTLGHNAGDQLLVEVSHRLLNGVRDEDIVTRFGGDEFVVLIPGPANEAHLVAERLVAAAAAPYDLDGSSAVVTASAGIVVVYGDADADAVLRDADVAMYQAKKAGKNRAAVFSPEARAEAEAHMSILTALRDTLEHHPDRFEVVYQPICDLSGGVIGAEALARWTDPELGVISPDVFIAAAEGSGFAAEVGEIIRGKAIADGARWRALGWEGYVSVNVSAGELSSDRLLNRLTSQLVAGGLSASGLCIEVTETAVMEDPQVALRILEDISGLGVSIAIDDFGTGHSSLAYLKRFPVSVLKLDREFVDGVEVDGEDRAICAAIVALAGALNLRVTAEGVETADQLAALRELGVAGAQGYLFSRPVPAEEIPALLGIG